ncbi:hypothetical protein AB0G32_29625 [Streptomyces sp. NPDC023723]|uniref:hypothetical protein n=1 Tax=Streptomyces sp. NPDC023723 TaxID=3154323 RepID=UPI0033DE84DC
MPRGRHRHSPPLHRLLPPSAIAGVSVVCAVGPWVFSETLVLRALAAAAAVTAVLGAVVMRHWDAQAGRQVADLTRARASDEWRFEERVAELESDLEESRELRGKLEQRLRAKRAELAGLRNEHAALLRRYATAETERASVLESRRRLELEAAPGAPALPAARSAPDAAPVPKPNPKSGENPEQESKDGDGDGAGDVAAPAVFSPEGSRLFLRARSALARLDADPEVRADGDGDGDGGSRADADGDGGDDGDGGGGGGREAGAAAEPDASRDGTPGGAEAPEGSRAAEGPRAPQGPEAAGGHQRAVAEDPADANGPEQPAQPTRRALGHFTVPTAVAVVPAAAPARRPVVEGGFDFFGNKTPQRPGAGADGTAGALEAVQNEDLADVVGQEALALHKAEEEAGFKPAGAESRGVGQVIDLTAHDETEQIDVEGLRSAVS